jgi:hypothetical protein
MWGLSLSFKNAMAAVSPRPFFPNNFNEGITLKRYELYYIEKKEKR